MTDFQHQVQQQARLKLAASLPNWLEEIHHKDMNSVAAQTELISRVFSGGVAAGVEIAQQVVKGEL